MLPASSFPFLIAAITNGIVIAQGGTALAFTIARRMKGFGDC
jgi:hypothetical protein